MEIKQHIYKQPTGYWRNKKNSRHKWQWKHDNSKPMGCSKSSSKKEIYSNKIKKQEKHWTDNLTLHIKQLEKEEKKKPKLVEGKKS